MSVLLESHDPVVGNTRLRLAWSPADSTVMLNRSFWKGRRVFLTGHTGFKGSWLSLWLNALGADVTGYALDPPTQPSLFDQARVSSAVRSICADIRDFPGSRRRSPNAVPKWSFTWRRSRSSVAATRIRSKPTPRMSWERYIFWRRCGSSDSHASWSTSRATSVMRTGVGLGISGRRNPWAGMIRIQTPRLRRTGDVGIPGFLFPPESFQERWIAVASARAGNAIGGGDWTSDQLIPDLIRAFLADKPCLIRNPSAIRPWQFVLEPLRGYLMLAERLAEGARAFASGWNFGPAETDAKPVSWIADRLAQFWGDGASWSQDAATHPHEAHYLKLDVSKSKASLGWQPVLPLTQALEWIVEWYRGFQAGGRSSAPYTNAD